MPCNNSEAVIDLRNAMCSTIDDLLEEPGPGYVEIRTVGDKELRIAVASSSSGTLFIDTATSIDIEGNKIHEYRVALAALEEECRRRNALVSRYALLLKSDEYPRVDIERVLYPHRRIFKKFNSYEPLVGYQELRRWAGIITSSKLVDEQDAADARHAAYESHAETFKSYVKSRTP